MDLRDRAADFRFLVRDQARQFTASSDTVLASAGIQAVQIRPEVLSRTPMSNGSVCDEALAGVVRVAELGEVLLVEQGHPQRPVIGGELADGGGRRQVIQPMPPSSLTASIRAEVIIPQSPARTSQLACRYLHHLPCRSPTPEASRAAGAGAACRR